MKCPQTLDAGVYVLGALLPSERDAFERHLGECGICRDEVADLAVLPGLLGRLDAATAEAIAKDGESASAVWNKRMALGLDRPAAFAGMALVPEPLLGEEGVTAVRPGLSTAGDAQLGGARRGEAVVLSLLDAARLRRVAGRRRTRARTAAAALAAACLVVIVGLTTPQLVADHPSGSAMTAMTAMNEVVPGTPVRAEFTLAPAEGGGTKVFMRCRYTGVTTGQWMFRLVLVARDGHADELATWTVGYGDAFEISAVSAMATADIGRVEVRRSDGSTLLEYRR